MKLTENWHGKKPPPKPKRVSPKPKIPWQLLGLPDPAETQKPLSMDEVRRQVSLMSGRGFGEAVRSSPSTTSDKVDGRNAHPRPRRGATE